MQQNMPFPIKCLGDVEKVDLNKLPHIGSGIKSLDRVIKGLFESQLVVISGKRGQGKSTFASWILSNALNQDRKIFAYSGELPDYNFRSWLDFQIAGAQNIDTTVNEWNDEEYTLRDDAACKLSAYYSGRAYIYDNSCIPSGNLQDTIIGSIRYAIDTLGCSIILIDNIMTAVGGAQDDKLSLQIDFVKKLKAFATEKKATILLVAHPRKTEQGKALVNDDVSGASEITNLADIVLTYSRTGDDEKYQSEIQVTKNRMNGRLAVGKGAIKVSYSLKSKRIYSDDDKNPHELMCCFKENEPPF